GVIPEASAERLREVGKWLAANGEAIYATQASPFDRPAWGRYTRRAGVIYAHVFDWPADGRLEVPVAAERIARAAVLGRDVKAAIEPAGKACTLRVGAKAADEDCTVVRIEMK
ncbi:MAG TPA: alpha-L-fucosidase, partial [Phycisphaerae bacterium]|nr:alpha-L-fucosidase [Phycisphaerae bacterium]